MTTPVYVRDGNEYKWHLMPDGEYAEMLKVARVLERKGYGWAVGFSEVPLLFSKDMHGIGELARIYKVSRLSYHAPIELHIEALEFLGTHGREWDMHRMRPVLFKVLDSDRDRFVALHGYNSHGGTELLVKGDSVGYTLDWHGSVLSEAVKQNVKGATRYNFSGVVAAAHKAYGIMYVRDIQPEVR